MLLIFFFTSLLILFSTLGYGFMMSKILKLETINYSYGIVGILGLLFLSIISSYTHLFTPHNYFHNVIIICIGLLNLFFFTKKNIADLKYLSLIFLLLFIAILIAKNNEDFSYYHLPNSLQFAQQKLQFGIGNLNHGFKHISSLFMLMSLNYLPLFEHYLFNLTNFLFLTFMISFLIKEIFYRYNYNLNFSQIILSLLLILFLTKFSRLSEYGSDLSGQIIIAVYVFFVLEIIFNDHLILKKKIVYFKISIALIVFAITTKFILGIYSLLLLLPLILVFKRKNIFMRLIEFRFIFLISLPIVFLFFFNFSSTGCLVYPIEKSCFSESLDWAVPDDVVKYLNFHYEVWSKGGKGPNFSVENQEQYIQSLNWFSNWISVYFFNKFSDYLLVIIFIIFIFSIFFAREILKKNFFKYKYLNNHYLFYISLLIIFSLWFLNFPSLRYAGYIVVYLLIIYPFSVLISYKINLSKKENLKKIFLILIISYSVFLSKNSLRLSNQFNIPVNENHNFNNFPFYWIKKQDYKEIKVNNHVLYLVKGSCWNVPSTCIRTANTLKVSKKNNYIFYSIR